MGGFQSRMKKVMDENMKEQQAFMLKTQKMQLERQLQMQQEMRKRMIAQQLAGSREAFNWYGSFYLVAATGLTAGYMKTKRLWTIIPLIPMSFFVGYMADMARGNKMERIVAIADEIVAKEQSQLALPGPPLTVELLDAQIAKVKAK